MRLCLVRPDVPRRAVGREEIGMAPVRDGDGRVMRRVRVLRGEMTCLACGEVTTIGFCPRCNGDEEMGEWFNWKRKGHEDAADARLVPTVSYLREGEFEFIS